MDWTHIRAFLATAEQGSLSAAARQLQTTQPTIGRQVAALEENLGVLLFERLGKSLHLTQSGAELLEHARTMGQAADRIALVAEGLSQSVEGRVRITASDVLSTHVLPAFLSDLQKQAPKLEVEIVATNELEDILRRDADIAIRHRRPEEPDLIARYLKEDTAHFYAAPPYLDRRGTPQTHGDLSSHDFISFGDPEMMLSFLLPMGLPLSRANFRLGSSNGGAAWEYARQGFGIGIMSDRVAGLFPEMVRLFPEDPPFEYPIWLCTHRELHTSRRIRLVFDLLADFLRRPE